jgi:hypothetical protein
MTAGGEPFAAERGEHAPLDGEGDSDRDRPGRLASLRRPGQSPADHDTARVACQRQARVQRQHGVMLARGHAEQCEVPGDDTAKDLSQAQIRHRIQRARGQGQHYDENIAVADGPRRLTGCLAVALQCCPAPQALEDGHPGFSQNGHRWPVPQGRGFMSSHDQNFTCRPAAKPPQLTMRAKADRTEHAPTLAG